MKKLILTLLLTSLATYSQTINVDLTVSNIIPVDFNNHREEATALTIPSDKIWFIQGNYGVNSFYTIPNSFSGTKIIYIGNNGTSGYNDMFLTGGAKVWQSGVNNALFNIIEFNAPSTQTGTLALNEIKEINNKIELFPNPTNSKIALNSEKNYTIEVYDMQGQIVMKDKGNTVDLSNLSNAVYILKAYDNYEKTTTSYKVVKK